LNGALDSTAAAQAIVRTIQWRLASITIYPRPSHTVNAKAMDYKGSTQHFR
jgi:hypothetical protein